MSAWCTTARPHAVILNFSLNNLCIMAVLTMAGVKTTIFLAFGRDRENQSVGAKKMLVNGPVMQVVAEYSSF